MKPMTFGVRTVPHFNTLKADDTAMIARQILACARSPDGGGAAGHCPVDHAIVIVNPVAGRRRRRLTDDAVRQLRSAIGRVDVVETRGPGDATVIARDADPDVGLVIVAGGDGTIAETVDGLLMRGPSSPRALRLGILPVGTANVLAAELSLTTVQAAVDRMISGAARTIHFGSVAAGDGSRRSFVSMVGAGFDADVVADVSRELKRRLGKGAYAVETALHLLGPCDDRLLVSIDGEPPQSVASVVVCNTRFYGGRFVLAPQARPDSPEFQVCLFRDGGRTAALRYLTAMVTGQMAALPAGSYSIVPGRRVDIDDARQPGREAGLRAVQADGDAIATLPVRVEVAPELLHLAL